MDPDVVSAAIVAWTGYHEMAWPHRDDARVNRALGPTVGAAVLPQVHALEADFFTSNARHTAKDLPQMARQASAEFAARHPDVSADAIAALAWCYAFAYK